MGAGMITQREKTRAREKSDREKKGVKGREM